MPWLFAKSLFGLSKGLWLLLAVAALATGIVWLRSAENADDKANQNVGAAVQREADLTATVQQVEKANEAAETVRRNPNAARADCLQDARNPADC